MRCCPVARVLPIGGWFVCRLVNRRFLDVVSTLAMELSIRLVRCLLPVMIGQCESRAIVPFASG